VPTETSIRRANQKDYATVLKFHQELYVRFRDQIAPAEALPLFAYRDLDTTLRDDVHGLLRARDTWVLLAERAGQAVGYVSGHLEVDARRLLVKRGVVEDWLVVEEARGHGVGKSLLAGLEAIFREQGCSVMESGTWAFNAGARKAHAAAGFTEIEVKMRKRL
jgi:GNAT superfamily N-acetyltransferase